MNKKKLEAEIRKSFGGIMSQISGTKFEPANDWQGQHIGNVFQYARISEACMENNMKNLKGCERKYTFMADLSIAEWCGGAAAVIDTARRVLLSWRDSAEAMAEFILSVNWKSWEHHARNNSSWSVLYSLLYEAVRDITYDYYEGDKEKTQYLFEYLD